MDKISIIIPVYNVEPYIRKCLDSVISQTHSELDILLVNDGSTDSSGKICDEYAQKDSRIRVFHKENGGLSSALNVGLENILGNYLGFVDSDDWIEPDMYETLYNAAKNKKVPISVTGYFKDTDTESTPMVNRENIPDSIISIRNMVLYPLKRDLYMSFCGYVWNKLYSADIIKATCLKFDEKIKYGMDVLFYASIVLNGKCTGTYVDKPMYHYYQRDTAISKSKSSKVKSDILDSYKKIEYLLDCNGYTNDSFWARGFYCYHASVVAEIAYKDNDEKTLLLMQQEIANHLEDYIKTNTQFPEKLERMRKLLDLKL